MAALLAGPQAYGRPLGGNTPMPSQAAQSASQEASRAAQQAANSLRRATQSIQAMQAAQQAARNLARTAPSTVQNGLQTGGLVVMPNATPGATNGGAGLWRGANLPTEAKNGGRTQVTVKQNQQKAILTWKEFNVGRETDLYFDQRAGGADAKNWIALNRVDPSAAPSQILGSIKAEGQVYVINRNGIVFGGASQVNVHTLVASSLSLSNAQFMAGINKELYVFNDGSGNGIIAMPQFGYLGQQKPVDGKAITDPAQIPRTVIGDASGDVRVEGGAQITTASGGKAMLFAPRVVNSGQILAPDGQVIMAAGEQIYLRTSTAWPDPVTSKSTFRGLDVAASSPMPWMFSYAQGALENDDFSRDVKNIVFAEMETRAASIGYRVVNNGIVQADHGNITLTARDVFQNGALLASTALNNRDGSIRLQGFGQGMGCYSSSFCDPSAGILWYWRTGTVTLAPGSVTAVMPDLSDTSEIELTSTGTRYRPGRVELRGNLINIEREANVIAPAGTISAVASTDGWATDEPISGEKKHDGSRIHIGEDAYLSVAGLQDILIAMERNVVEAELRINELRDSPLFKDSWLRGQKIYVDRRASGTFSDGLMSGVRWLTDENGNYIPGAWQGTPLADVSAWVGVGKTNVAELSTQGGSITLKSAGSLITRPGSLLDVSGGSVRYTDGWIKTTRLIGADGRIYDIGQARPDQAYVAFAGGFTRSHDRWDITETWTSPLGRTGGRYERGYTEGRKAGSIQFYAAQGVVLEGSYWGGTVVGERQAASGKLAQAGTLAFGDNGDDAKQWLLGNLIISNSPVQLPADFSATTPLTSFWYSGTSDPSTNDDSFLRRTTYLDPDALGAAGFGKIDLYVSKSFTLEKGTALELAPGSSFTVQANTVNAYTQDFRVDGVIRAAGGSVKLNLAENVYFGSGAAIDVSGQWVNQRTDAATLSAPVIGGGSIEVMNARFEPGAILDVSGGGWYRLQKGKYELRVGDAGAINFTDIDAAEVLKADLRSYTAGSGGSLTLTTGSSLQIGGAASAPAGTVRLAETLYSELGFRSVQITSRGDITIADGATIRQLPRSVDVTDAARFESATSIADMGPPVVLPLSQRADLAPTSLSLTGRNVTIGAGATVATDVGGSITLAAHSNTAGGAIKIDGRLEALAGRISVAAASGTVIVGGTAALVANGVPRIEANGRGQRDGVVLGGGSVTFDTGSIVLESGSLIDVSGASGEIDVPAGGTLGSQRNVPVTLASNGGSISVKGQGLIDGTWRGQAGGSGARGGAVSLSTTTTPLILSDSAAAQAGLIFRPSILQSSGFADLTLNASGSSVRLGGVDLTMKGSISIGGALVNGSGADSRLSASYISLYGTSAAAPASSGKLTLAATVIDVKEVAIRGFAQAVLEATDIRLTPYSVGQPASLDMAGVLVLRAAQIYPASQTSATIKASEKIIVQQKGAAGVALSAGGSLTLQAPVIEQSGTLRAPFGQIVLKATDKLTLGAGSVTSVTGDGLILPYGNLSNNENWTLPTGSGLPPIITSPPEKRITLDAPSVDLVAGSVVDIRGGGDLHVWEHVTGPGGSHDVLTRPGMYAIMPALGPVTAIGERIWLAGDWYTLLPARYALLPGAYAVQMVSGSQGASLSGAVGLADGSAVMTGYRGNALDGSHDQLPSSWRVMSGDVVRKYSEYNEAYANTFFASDAFKLTQYRLTGKEIVTPRLAMDGGAVVFKATQELILNGQLRSQAVAGGRGGLVDIAAEKIAVVGAEQDAGALRTDGYLVLDATSLSNFGAGSLLLGGTRSGDTRGLRVDVAANDIIVRNSSSSALTGPEIILAASETIDIGAGSVIAARGEAPSGAGDLVVAPQVISDNGTPSRDWGALIRLSNGDAVRVIRENVDLAAGGVVTIGAGATLAGGKSLLIDATRNTYMRPGAQLSGATLSVASGRIGFGGGSGLVLDQAALAMLRNTQNLVLRSYTSIDFHNAVDLSGLRAVTFDAAVLAGYGTNSIDVVANRLVLENSTSTFSEPTGAGHGRLNLVAEELAFGQGAKALRGFDTVVLTGTTRIVGEGNGSLDAGNAAVTLFTPLLTGRGGAGQSLTTTGGLTVAAYGTTAPARDQDSLGARWSLTGGSVVFGGRADALGGAVELTATHGDVILTEGALIDVGGFSKQFFDVAEYTDAGRIALTAFGGSVRMRTGAVLDLAAQPGGGGAGSLAITSDGSQLVLDGTIRAQAAAGQRGGSFSLDVAQLSNFAALNQRLNEAGFSKSRGFRIRTGDITVDGTTVTESFTLAADHGRVTIAGAIDARARYGGSIAIYGGNGLTMTNTAVLRAGATDSADHLGSGRVTLGISDGTLAVQGGVIDVAGGEGGKVTLRAPVIVQPGADTVNVSFAGSIAGAREIVLEGFKRFDLASLASNPNFVGVKINGSGQAELDLAATAVGKLNVLADYGAGTLVEFVRDFDISAAYGALGGLASQSNFHARPGMQLNYAGDIVLKSNWNLGAGIVDEAGARAAGVMGFDAILNKSYLVAGRKADLLTNHTTMVYRTQGSIFGEPGVLSLRAGGDLVLEGSITDGFFQFADPLDKDYLAKANWIKANYTLLLNGGFNSGGGNTALLSWSDYLRTNANLPPAFLALGFGLNTSDYYIHSREEIFAAQLNIPYSAAANSPAARGTLPGNAGDPLRYAELFPAVTKPGGEALAPASWSYALIAGAAPSLQSASPMQRSAGAAGSIVLKEQASFSYTLNPSDIVGTIRVDVVPAFSTILDPPAPSPANDWDNDTKLLTDWLSWMLEPNRYAGLWNGGSLRSDGTVALVLGSASIKDQEEPKLPANSGSVGLRSLWEAFSAGRGLKAYNASSPSLSADYKIYEGGTGGYHIVMPLSTLQLFFSEKIACSACAANRATILSTYTLPSSGSAGRPATQHITTRPTTLVRSGTGDVSLAANGDVRLDGQASIYSAGRRDLAVYNDFTTAPANAVYGVGGGHVDVTAGGNISVKLPEDRTQMQHYVEWLQRQGTAGKDGVFSPTEQSSWWVDYANFQRGIGALGGGNVAISAGGDLDNLTVALPTNGRVRGGRTADERKLLEMRNGGAMTVTAGGSVRAGYYHIGRGAGTIEAGNFAVGRIVIRNDRGSYVSAYPIAPILSLGDATLDVSTAGDLLLQTVLDPLLLGKGVPNEKSYMSGLTDRSALSLTSVGGDVTLVGQTKYLSKDLTYVTDREDRSYEKVNDYAANLYPSKTLITALNGSVQNRAVMNVMPGTNPELRILAGNDVMPGSIVMGRGVLDLMPSPFMPKAATGSGNEVNLGAVLFSDIIGPSVDDYEPSRIYAREGTIFIGDVYANEQTWFRAGKDIRDINYRLRNLHATDVSLLEAGNDIIGGTRQIGSVLGGTRYGGQVEILGPGALVLSAGRDVYGTDLVIYSRGNQSYDANNRVIPGTRIAGLPDQGASITVMAGLKGKQPSYEAFMTAYLDPANVAAMPDYLKTTLPDGTVVPLYLTDAFETRKSGNVKSMRNGLVSFVEEMTGEKLSPLDAWTRFKTLPQFTQERFLRQVYMQELREAGSDQKSPGEDGQPRNVGYNRGYAAIEKLFPGQDWKGDVTMGNALFRTMAGGDIEVLTPGGGLQVAALGTDPGAGYGLVTLGYGDINIFARNNVVVNRSRILTFAGGDETIWSTLGDIDAGRGAKTTRVPSAPEIQTDADTVTKVLEKADISGSGIGTIVGFTGVEEGDVHLIAPQGTVNAGDAGVRVSGNLNIAALFVLNANNFQVSGEVKGLPAKESSITPLKLEGGDASQKAATDAAKDVTQSGAGQQASIIIVEVLGFGGGGGDAPVNQDEQQERRGGVNEQRTQNPDSAYQVLGAGQMTADEARQVIAERRRVSGQR
ncbi:filamentous hemagglutinin N-terminal domain-containing protein [Bradyrhizobium sp. CSA112]|uniref:filamentous haemagglutinin family protein n=1 Tax=Bradyrhizobium sp. CSA112 TaxID=2699170 RepID=UPI0023AF0352|nr:filamentous haemagglutinin family protein [Bradyrhizobium sp. CSA112]MDE5457055.1 filamentous hemagglutinin N-terminal domain-containing protein [Bradyrhizobium sp. CSA112]